MRKAVYVSGPRIVYVSSGTRALSGSGISFGRVADSLVAERCGFFREKGDRHGPATKAPCDRPKGHPGRHHSGNVEDGRKRSAIARAFQKDPTHSYYWVHRENNWAKRGIQTSVGGRFTRAEFWELWFAQRGACAVCGKLFGDDFGDAVRKANVDHWHRHGKFGPARALLCWRCNRDVGDLTYERARLLWDYLRRFAPSTEGIDNPSITLP